MVLRLIVRLYCVLQLPHERTNVPKVCAAKSDTFSVPAPLNWNTLSLASFAPPPLTVYTLDEEEPRKVAASSPTSSHQTFCRVQLPRQWMPSAAGEPMMTFLTTAPGASSRMGPWSSSWLPVPRSPLPYRRSIP